MPRKKKEETKEVVKNTPDFGSGMTRLNNMLVAGYSLKDIKEEQKNE